MEIIIVLTVLALIWVLGLRSVGKVLVSGVRGLIGLFKKDKK